MDGDPHCPLVFRKNTGNEAHRSGKRDGRPREKEDGADYYRLPVTLMPRSGTTKDENIDLVIK